MILLLLKVVISVLFAMSFFHKLWKRSISTFSMLIFMFSWSVVDIYSHKLAYGIVIIGVIIIYFRAMLKNDKDKFFF